MKPGVISALVRKARAARKATILFGKNPLKGGKNKLDGSEPRKDHILGASDMRKHSHLMSYIRGGWSDKVHRRERKPLLATADPSLERQHKRGFNPNPMHPNRGTRKYREFSERTGGIITKTKRYWIGEPGSMYQLPAPELLTRGVPTLFDDCVQRDSRWDDDCPRHMHQHLATPYRLTVPVPDADGKPVMRERICCVAERIKYHLPSGVLPAYRQHARPVKPAKVELDQLVAEYRARKQLEYVQALIDWRS